MQTPHLSGQEIGMVVSSLIGKNLKDTIKWIPGIFMYLFVYLFTDCIS